MANKMTQDDKLLLDHRRKNLDRSLDNIRNLLSGRSASFLPFITDETGNTNSEKLKVSSRNCLVHSA